MILLPSINRPARLALSSEFQWSEHCLQASSPFTGTVHRYLAFGPPSWPKMKAQNRTFSRSCVAWQVPEAVSFCGAQSHLCRLSSYVRGCPRTKVAPAAPEAEAFRTRQIPVLWLGGWLAVCGPKRVLPQRFCGSACPRSCLVLWGTFSSVQINFLSSA